MFVISLIYERVGQTIFTEENLTEFLPDKLSVHIVFSFQQ